MLKGKKLKIGLLVLGFVFYLNLSGLMAADICPGPFSTFTENWQYDESWLFYLNPDNPQEIDRESSVEISVIGGFSPYTWQVSGNGFSLSLNETEDLSNALYANDTACGTATITVTDKCGDTCTGYVRGTVGRWVEKGAYCGLFATGQATETNLGGGFLAYEYIQGNQRQLHNWDNHGVWNYENCGVGNCLAYCNDPPGIECTPCLDWNAAYNARRTPCCNEPTESLPDRSRCGTNYAYHYFEWEC